MTRLQEVLLELEGTYLGNPYYVSGNALYSALAPNLSETLRDCLQVSAGMFVPGEVGGYAEAHSPSGSIPPLSTGLQPVERYADLFLFRDSTQRWLAESRPRDARNIQSLKQFGNRTGYTATRSFDLPADHDNNGRTVTWYLHWYCHLSGTDSHPDFPLSEEALSGLQLGGARNYGFGYVSCEETRCVDLEALSYDRLEEADAYEIELLTPYVLHSEHARADDQAIPWWWEHDRPLRRRDTRLVRGDENYRLETVDHGQIVQYTGSDPITTAKNGICRVGTHSQFGFGEFRVRPAEMSRVPEQAAGAATSHPTGGARNE